MNKCIQFLLLLLLATETGGCSPTPPSDQSRNKPTPLANADAFAAEYREAVRAVAASLEVSGERAEDFYAEIDRTQGGGQILIFHLWHASAFERRNHNVVGNPGGKCRDVEYDAAQGKVVQTLFWQ